MKLEKKFDSQLKTWLMDLSGEVDVSNASALRLGIESAFEESPGDIIIDISELKYIDSMGLGNLIGIYGSMKKANFKLSLQNAPDNIKKLLTITGLDKVLLI
jgi:anti-sigma B factor antagonist